ncbi:UDP-N-acetylhexosamine pyrophosphorylase-like protein 1 [Austrofundulus limnaeus]|uniref:UDP-N-acetylhexosamine pyrophosphorylase-like protein 1 n=1 Tax=Austrofundulus limnaeus TaxID=52670 RepID=A0A2I4AIS6_AUSLI|nr:PREDICTED: UDP-N-acetylhexosamine pyrophosphorylase-like protein 1 [Austrofundulus limnaeus]XP_013887466.1 PREDICTED: UDP-N-acetylhexosamine pyrophosphorylase-like protein 1 [Austrofundulus limnaeus]
MSRLEQLQQGLDSAGQAHVLRFWSELSEEQQEVFLQDLVLLDLQNLKEHCEAARRAAAAPPSRSLDRDMEPVPPDIIGSVKRSDPQSLSRWEDEGLLQISKNRVAVLLLAGGQGTRLGVPYPKGMFDVGLPSHKTLYQIQAQRIHKVQELAEERHGSRCTVPWYIMTSEFTLSPTQTFFRQNRYFGLKPSDIIMFEQRMLPAVTCEGRVILEGKGKIAMAPDGNGGLYQALVDHQVLEDMQQRGVEYVHVYCVDNILVKMADPLFIGFCVSRGADCGAKVVEKAHPAEAVGVVCRVRGVPQVVEYSEIQPETASLRGPEGELVYSAGNICNHFFSRTFLQEVAEKFKDQLKQHVAIKKVPYVDSAGNQLKPAKANGIKMEKFVFDVFPFSRNFVVFEVIRKDEFAPLKNADGAASDTPTSVRTALMDQHRRWLCAAGASLLDGDGNVIGPETSESSHPVICEVSPLVSYFGEGLELLLKGKTLQTPFVLDENTSKVLKSQKSSGENWNI